jgi:hypothetical protein
VHPYVSAEGRREVCQLCAGRAEALGWLPADQEGAEETLSAVTGRKPGFFARLFARPEGEEDEDRVEEDEAGAMAPPAPDAPRRATHELETERYDVEAEWVAEPEGTTLPSGQSADLPAPDEVPEPELSTPPAAPAPEADASPAPLPDPAGRGMRPRRLQPDLPPAGRFERAIARFNSGDVGRTVSGLTRTLGAPSVSVGDLAGDEDVVRVTVAWELTWYQWGVDLGDELRPVFELEKGYEVSEIDGPARQWNASAHDGRIVMVAPSRREAENGRPVHR